MDCNAHLVASVLEPLAFHVSPRTLSRIARSCKAIADVIGDAEWAAAGEHAGFLVHYGLQSLKEVFQQHCVFCCDATANASISGGGRHVVLDLGSANPPSRRVAAAQSVRSLGSFPGKSVTLHCVELSHARNHHCVLWLGVLFDKFDGGSLDSSSLEAALAGYSVTNAKTSMGERFSRGKWSMNALGSSGAVWSDCAVSKMVSCTISSGSIVTLTLDEAHCELRIRVVQPPSQLTAAASLSTVVTPASVSDDVTVRRLVRRGSALPPMHVIAHLTDCALPAIGLAARAVIDVVYANA